MEPFLHHVAKYVAENYQDDIENICIVFPNRRARLFFKRELAKVLQKTIFTPKILSIEEFVLEIVGRKNIDSTEQLFLFYSIYREQNPGKHESFDEFASWGTILLSDFNEIDSYLINTKSFFEYVNDERALTVWSPERKEISDFQKQYLDFWKSLPHYYNEFVKRLNEDKNTYQGLAYRLAADIITKSDFTSYKKVIFAGLNALNAAEEKIIQTLIKKGKAITLWDSDNYFISNEEQEAGRFLRNHQDNEWYKKHEGDKEFKWKFDNFREGKKQLNFIAVPKNIGQANEACNVLSTLYNPHQPKDCALILADEGLLLPVLNNLPENVDKVNITMGYSLKNTLEFSFLSLFVHLFSGSRVTESGNKFYTPNLIEWLNHPLFKLLVKQNYLVNELKNEFLKSNRFFISANDIGFLSERTAPLWSEIYTTYLKLESPTGSSLIEKAQFILSGLKAERKDSLVEMEFILQLRLILLRIKELNNKYAIELSLQNFQKIFYQLVSSSEAAFFGEPLQGLQIMGMLESRALDFKKIIITGLNEGILPAGKKGNSFIPYEVKKIFGLPTYSEKDAIFSFHFYRLISRAEELYLIYNSDSDSFNGAEKSRFITQIENELCQYAPNITLNYTETFVPVIKSEATGSISIRKNEAINKLIEQRLKNGLAPTALNALRNCSLRFYFNEIAKLKPSEEIEESIDAAGFGTITHNTLERIFEDFKGRQILAHDLKAKLATVENIATKEFQEHTRNRKIEGKNLLLLKAIIKLITNFLKQELILVENNKLELVSLEEKLSFETEINGVPVILKGKADRIDRINGQIRIIDYKTGTVTNSELKLDSVDDFLNPDKNDKAFQLLSYAYLYYRNNPTNIPTACIISFKDIKAGNKPLTVNGNDLISITVFNEFEKHLSALIAELISPATNFTQTTNADYCKYCDYKQICNR